MIRSRYVKGPARGSYPGRLVSIVVSTKTPADVPARRAGVPRVFSSAHVSWADRRRGAYTPARSIAFGTPGEFWRWYECLGRDGSKVYTFSPVASDALVHLHGFDRFTRLGSRWLGKNPGGDTWRPGRGPGAEYGFKVCVLAGKPDIVEYVHATGKYIWLSGGNYFRESEGMVANAVGYKWRTQGEGDDGPHFVCTDPGDRAAMWLAAVVALAEWWGPLCAGRFPNTAPAGAWSFLRSRIPPRTVLDHNCPDTLRLERMCCHGGRSTTWFYGDIRPRGEHSPPPDLGPPPAGWPVMRGPVVQFDVKSAYPALMRDEDYPVKRSHFESGPTVRTLSDMVKNYHVLAAVYLRTDRAEYPHRRRGRVMYPVGRFLAYLATPELVLALDAGEVESVACAAYYFKGRPFARAAAELIRMRDDAHAAGRVGWELFVKLVSNSMTGKLAPRTYQFVPAPHVTLPEPWGVDYRLDVRTGVVRKYVARAGLVWERQDAPPGRGTLPACYAVLQSYCRVMMRRFRELCPPRSVVSQGTDGLWVTRAAAPVLSQACPSGQPRAGLLRRGVSVSNARFLDSKHYWCDGVWTVAGMPSASMDAAGTSYAHSVRLNPVVSSPPSAPVHTYECERHAVLSCRPIDLIVGPDGWGQPVRLPYLPGQQPAAPDAADPEIPW